MRDFERVLWFGRQHIKVRKHSIVGEHSFTWRASFSESFWASYRGEDILGLLEMTFMGCYREV